MVWLQILATVVVCGAIIADVAKSRHRDEQCQTDCNSCALLIKMGKRTVEARRKEMSILIKGMEMPTDRPQLLWVYPNGKALTVQSDVDPWKELQAIPVPPHGRLGDLDELHKEAVRRSEKAGTHDIWYNCVDRVISAFDIDRAPTIIPASE